MEETNKTLALLLVASIVVSLGGTIVSLNKLGQIGFTGMVTDSGTVELNITSDTTITFTKTSVNFGSGYVNSSCNNCTMFTNATDAGQSNFSTPGCCLGDWQVLSAGASTGLWVQNEGNTNLTVNLNFSKDADAFLEGSNPSPEFQYWIKGDANGTCTGTCNGDQNDNAEACGGNLALTDTWYDANGSNMVICPSNSFKPIITEDEFAIDIRVLVPRNANPTNKSVTLTLTGTAPS